MSFNLDELAGQLKAISADNAACTNNLKTAERKMSISMETSATASGADSRENKSHEEAMEEITKALESAYKVQEKLNGQIAQLQKKQT